MSPSSSPSSPADLLSSLSLNPGMSATGEEVRARAVDIRDVLSSFDRHVFPSEYRPDIFANLERPVDNRPLTESERTIQQDLEASLLQWGSYDKQAWQVIMKLQPLRVRTRCFHEKLHRKLEQLFYDYDILDGTIGSSQEAHDEVGALAQRFTNLITALLDDQQYREGGQSRSASYALGALIGVCNRHDDIMLSDLSSPMSQRSGGSTILPPRSDVSLFQVLVRNSDSVQTGGLLMLKLLDRYPTSVVQELETQLVELVDLLNSHGAPASFIRRVERLLHLAQTSQPLREHGSCPEEDSEPSLSARTAMASRVGVPVAAAVTAPTPASVPGVETRAGSKRSAATAENSTTKRGRKKLSSK